MPQAPNSRPKRTLKRAESAAPKDEWAKAFEEFDRMMVSRNFRPSTRQTYRWILLGKRVTEYRKEHGIKAPKDFTLAQLQAFQSELLQPHMGFSSYTVHSLHRNLRTFLGWCLEDGTWDIGEDVKRWEHPKLDQVEKEVFTEAEEQRLYAAADAPRDKFILKLLRHTGIRLGELCRLQVEDIGDDVLYVSEEAKARKPRRIPLESSVYDLKRDIREYLKKGRPKDTDRKELVLTIRKFATDENGKAFPGGEYDYRALDHHSVQSLLRRLSEQTGVRANPHKFRHTFATRMAKEVNVLALQKVMGHTSVAVTSRYYEPDDDELIKTFREGSRRVR